MANARLLIWMTLLVMIWLTYRQWLYDYPPEAPPATTAEQSDAAVPPPPGIDTLPQIAPPTAEAPLDTAAAVAVPGRQLRVRTDVLELTIDLHGGDLVRADVPGYPVNKNEPDVPVRLLDYAPESRWVYQSGLRSASGGEEPNHLADYTSAATEYTLAEGADELAVVLEWAQPGALAARKVFRFRRGSYAIALSLELENHSAAPWTGVPYVQLVRHHVPVERSYTSVDSYSFRGPVIYDGDRYHKLDVDDIAAEPVEEVVTGGWLAGIQHHFLAAAVPPPEEAVGLQAAMRGSQYVLTALGSQREIAPGGRLEYPLQLFVGPKVQDQLAETAERLELTVDYGVLTVLAQPLFWLLAWVHGIVGNWGWAIVLVTLLIKAAFYKLTEASGRSMAKMRKVQPRLKTLQERYKDDRQALSQAMMKLYKEEKINPAAGCLPILIQMPFFFAFYWVLIESVEIRQAPFMLWIDDLSVRDPFFVLPALMMGAMLLQTHLNPAPPDPVQARVMKIMPIAFGVMFAFFPAGLVLYWLTNTALSILQQWRINKLIAA
ncbi:MAG TPA: membrane protein insertase YidC [Gammaproteobacteria bacterium]|nr:membrane protein insertase YidC [Gammaproteobacteria bacterium]